MLDKFRKAVASLINPAKNAMSLPNQYLKYGSRGRMEADWSEVSMSDKDFYTGYGYAVIRKNANKVARIAMENVRTQAEDENFTHPYLPLITDSKNFTEHQFWRDISIFLDLEGVYYLMALRNASEGRTGNIQEFKMLNPYNIRRVLDGDNLEVAGYVETRKGMTREISKEMIIPMRDLNPFSEDVPYSMSDAAREAQFTIKTGGDYTRNALRHNINAPGILTTDVILEGEQFTNFVSRVKQHNKGEPLFGNGAGAIDWKSMDIDLSKAALPDIHKASRESLFAVSGVSKTIMGIEESGTTRDTANIQKDLNTEDNIIPRIQLILDALNLDYVRNSPVAKQNKSYLIVDNPLATDHEADLKEVEKKTKQVELLKMLVNAGVKTETAAKFVEGELDLEEIGDIEKMEPIVTEPEAPKKKEEAKNQAGDQVAQQSGALKNAVVNVEEQIVLYALNKVSAVIKNAFEEDQPYTHEKDVITKQEKEEVINELLLVLVAFYGSVMAVQGKTTMRQRATEHMLPGLYKLDSTSKAYIKEMARKVSESHVDTVLDDILVTAREAALKGLSVPQIQSLIKEKYNRTIVETRATAVARTETNRAFTRAQFEADRQFIKQNSLEGRAFKQWQTRSGNPCAFCSALEAEGPIPFDNAFRDLGDHVKAGDESLAIDFESLEAGNAHPNCSCQYVLIIKSAENAIENMEKMYAEMDKRTKESKELLADIQKERAKLDEDKVEFEKQLDDLDKLLDE